MMIAYAVVMFDDSYLSPGLWILLPVGGAVLVIVFAIDGTFANRLLANKFMVGIGLISYSLYLWHQPLFALARVYSVDPIGPQVYAILIIATFVLAYLTWRFVETPLRNRQLFSRQTIFVFSIVGSISAIGFGLYLDRTYGMYLRVYDKNDNIADFDKRIYNSRVFNYKIDHFSNDGRRRIFVIGNSFGRDFVNMTTETFDTREIEFAYSDTADACIDNNSGAVSTMLFLQADIVVFASGYDDPESIAGHCVAKDIDWAREHKKALFFIGTKNFGYNLNWIIRLPAALRANQYNSLPDFARRQEDEEEKLVPKPYFISLLGPVLKDDKVPITDAHGKPISTDRVHVTKYGAIFFGEKVLKPSAFGALLMGNRTD